MNEHIPYNLMPQVLRSNTLVFENKIMILSIMHIQCENTASNFNFKREMKIEQFYS